MTVEDVEDKDEDMRPRGNLPPKDPDNILELSDDGDSPLKKVPKKTLSGGQNKLKSRPTVIESSEESDHNNEKETHTANINSDTELEENRKKKEKKETPEEELGKSCIGE